MLRALARAPELDADTSAYMFALAAPDPVRPSDTEGTPDWPEIAAQTAAALRAEADPRDPRIASLIDELAAGAEPPDHPLELLTQPLVRSSC
ncbi:hypothetical protein [Streptomyces sp. NPDC021096]|uniref:MmyB family transcriptional regulator n=1 Tax=Streptomyces sp. NPDC021096 TaxID=3154792 RepID=UPI0033EFC596